MADIWNSTHFLLALKAHISSLLCLKFCLKTLIMTSWKPWEGTEISQSSGNPCYHPLIFTSEEEEEEGSMEKGCSFWGNTSAPETCYSSAEQTIFVWKMISKTSIMFISEVFLQTFIAPKVSVFMQLCSYTVYKRHNGRTPPSHSLHKIDSMADVIIPI